MSWYLADHLGTVRDLINNSGAIIDHVDFSAFGTVLDETQPDERRSDDGLRDAGARHGHLD